METITTTANMNTSNEPMKRCSKCGRLLPLESFHRSAKAKDGRQSYCRECSTRWNQEKRGRKAEQPLDVAAVGTYTAGDSPLAGFTPRELLQELKRRGYRWTDMTITLNVDFAKI